MEGDAGRDGPESKTSSLKRFHALRVFGRRGGGHTLAASIGEHHCCCFIFINYVFTDVAPTYIPHEGEAQSDGISHAPWAGSEHNPCVRYGSPRETQWGLTTSIQHGVYPSLPLACAPLVARVMRRQPAPSAANTLYGACPYMYERKYYYIRVEQCLNKC